VSEVELDVTTSNTSFEIAELESIRAKVLELPDSDEWYADPNQRGYLPFLFLSPRLPTDRFTFAGDRLAQSFEYIGREAFKTVWNKVVQIQLPSVANRLYIHGTIGYGKSHILAALACFLARRKKMVVYLPDCREMLKEPFTYIQRALLCAVGVFDPSNLSLRVEIARCSSVGDVVKLARNRTHPRWFFIIDQLNAFDREGDNEDEIDNDSKSALFAQLMEITSNHYQITSASANKKTAKHMEQKQTGDLKMSLQGGMSEVMRMVSLLSPLLTRLFQVEMAHWWSHYRERVPKFRNCSVREWLEYLTGRIPLLLRPLLAFNGKDFDDAKDSFWQAPQIMDVEKHIQKFASTLKRTERAEAYNE
jgi:hypothetical protein